MALLASGGSAQLRKDAGTAGAVQGFRADGELQGARLATALPFDARLQAGDAQVQLAQQIAVTGTLDAVETGADAFEATGTAGSAGIVGSIVVQESGADTLSCEGVVRVHGTLSANEAGSDILSASGAVRVAGVLAAIESGNDALAASGSLGAGPVTGTVDATEVGADTITATGSLGIVPISGAMASTESGADTLGAAGAVRVAGTMAASEAANADTFASEGLVLVRGALSSAEAGADGLEASGHVPAQGELAATETGADTMAAQGEGIPQTARPLPDPSRIAALRLERRHAHAGYEPRTARLPTERRIAA